MQTIKKVEDILKRQENQSNLISDYQMLEISEWGFQSSYSDYPNQEKTKYATVNKNHRISQ